MAPANTDGGSGLPGRMLIEIRFQPNFRLRLCVAADTGLAIINARLTSNAAVAALRCRRARNIMALLGDSEPRPEMPADGHRLVRCAAAAWWQPAPRF